MKPRLTSAYLAAAVSIAIVLASPTVLVTHTHCRSIQHSASASVPASSGEEHDAEVSPPTPASGGHLAMKNPVKSTLHAGAALCEGQGKNAASFNFAIGDFAAKIVLDHIFPADESASFILDDMAVKERALRAHPGAPREAFINILFVETGKDRIIVDTGFGPLQNGTLVEELQANDIDPGSITKILITHAHMDHIKGIFRDAEAQIPAFPNAKYYVSKTEWDFWTAPNVNISGTAMPPIIQAMTIQTAKNTFQAIKKNVVLFDLNSEVIPGVHSVSTPWHTPGHSAYLFKSGNASMLATGDSLGSPIFSVENPWFRLFSDLPPAAGPAGRYMLLDRVVQEKWLIHLMHGTFPGLGYVTEDKGTRFNFHPLRWTPAPGSVSVCPV